MSLCLHFKDRRTEEQKIKEQRGNTHKKTYVLLFLCLHFLKDRRTKEQKIKRTTRGHAQKTYVLLFLCQKRKHTQKLMFFCSYVEKENTHRKLCSFVLMSKKKTHTETYVLLFLCPKERITLLNHTFSSVQSAISNSSTSVLSR